MGIKTMKAYHVTINTESGDHYDLGLYDAPPITWAEKLAIVESYIPEEIYDGLCYAFVNYEEVDFEGVQKLPPPSPNVGKVFSL